jgi:hypothetical protein
MRGKSFIVLFPIARLALQERQRGAAGANGRPITAAAFRVKKL